MEVINMSNNSGEMMPDYTQPLSNVEIARNNPIYSGTYKTAAEEEDYYTMAETERDIRNSRKPREFYSRQINATVAILSILIIMVMLVVILL